MSTFERRFSVAQVSDALEANPWFADLLRRWEPAGGSSPEGPAGSQSSDTGANLRLAVRNGYLNFYQAGQSVARVELNGRNQLQAKIHEKYIHGAGATGQKYVALTSDGYLDREDARRTYLGMDDLGLWISNAKKYGGEEKAFVEQVVSRNENVVDLEMALPAYSPSERTAPRMDLVALEAIGPSWKIVFWEAKLVKDSRARCSGDAEPEVCRQLKSYTTWLAHGQHKEHVTKAYTGACEILVGMHAIAKTLNPGIRPLGEAIVAIASGNAAPLTVDDKPRLLIDDREGDASFSKHLQKLLDLDHRVQMVEKSGDMRLQTA